MDALRGRNLCVFDFFPAFRSRGFVENRESSSGSTSFEVTNGPATPCPSIPLPRHSHHSPRQSLEKSVPDDSPKRNGNFCQGSL